VLTGRGEGRRYVLNKQSFTIGRAELADLPLFGDASLDRTQAIARPADGGYLIEEVGGRPLLRVDGQPATSGWLNDGSLLELGRHRLRFSMRGTSGSAAGPFSPPAAPLLAAVVPPLVQGSGDGNPAGWQAAGAGWPADVPEELGIAPAGPGGAIRLRAEAGPHAGAVFPVPPGGGRLGRAPENAISLSADAMASRQHAEIFPEGGGWVLRDLGSRNGTMVNGEVVAEAWIHPGDEIRLGTGVYRVEEAA
jgi:pSer/pThr/pTyr-binding forkhead associated (FHA) protein